MPKFDLYKCSVSGGGKVSDSWERSWVLDLIDVLGTGEIEYSTARAISEDESVAPKLRRAIARRLLDELGEAGQQRLDLTIRSNSLRT